MADIQHTLFGFPSVGAEYREFHRTADPSMDTPVQDIRYPAYPATSQDGRLVTDYRPQCSKNVRVGQQFHTKKWMIEHADVIMDESRRRYHALTGAGMPMANTVPPPAVMVHSTPFTSELVPVPFRGGIGVERADASAPELFGTFSYEPSFAQYRSNRKNIAGTTVEEGGRNSRR